MTPEEWEKVSEIFHSALDREPEKRAAFLDKACGADTILRQEVESLLSANSEINDFIDSPAVDLTDDPLPELPSLTGAYFAHYRIDKSIGRGGMGEVYLATDTRLERQVAIKKLPDRFVQDPVFLRRFQNEARAAATLNHPHLATIYSVEEFEGKPFITMEYVEGKTLDNLTPERGLDLPTFLDWFISLAKGFRHAHERGVTHRDIKPGNIMISTEGIPKILDFGLAQVNSIEAVADAGQKSMTVPGQILGTPSYMSPEQAEGKDVDHRSDIFSFGILMYEALTGERPFTGDSNAEIISNLLKSDPRPISRLRLEVPQLLARVIERCLRKKRRDRIQSMQEIATLLTEVNVLVKRGVSAESFGRRLYRETTTSGARWRLALIAIVPVIAFASWYYISYRSVESPSISFDKMSMRRLSDTSNVGYAQISPDGRSIAFATFEKDGTRGLWIRRVDDRNALVLVPPERIQFWGGLAFAPDGGQIYYIIADRIGTHGTLFRVSSIGGPPRKLVDLANDVGGVSADGDRILFVRYGEPSQIITARTSDGGDEQVILSGGTEGRAVTNFRDPQFSRDGQSVYYIKYIQNEGVEDWSLEELRLSDRTARTIYRQPERISELAQLPGSDLLITAVDPVSNLQQIFHVSLADGKKTRLTNDLFFYFGVSADREGKNIVASQRSDEQRVWVGDASEISDLKPLNLEPNAHRTVDWTPDGRIVYDGYENNVAHVWISEANGKNLQKLTTAETDDSEPRVSGDGRYIVFTSKRSGPSQVWRMNIDGGDQVLLANVSGVTQAPRFAADGQTVVFEWLHGGARTLAAVPVTGGAVSEIQSLGDIPSYNSYYWAESPDGKYVAYSIWDGVERRMKIAVRHVDQQKIEAVLNIWPSLIFKWSADGKSIYYRERQAGYVPENEVLQVDLSSGKSKTLLSAAPEYIVDLTFSADGKKVAVVRGRNTSNAVLLTGST